MSNKIECPSCGKEQPSHFFAPAGVCIACAASADKDRDKDKAEEVKKETYYTEEEPVCTACQG